MRQSQRVTDFMGCREWDLLRRSSDLKFGLSVASVIPRTSNWSRLDLVWIKPI